YMHIIIVLLPNRSFSIFIHWVLGGQWSVWYPEKTVCAVRGSTVVIKCTYDYPERNGQVNQTMWCLNDTDCIDTEYVCHSENISIAPQFKDRAQCLGDKQKNCSLKVMNIRDTDAGEYRFRFITDKERWTGQDGVTLNITELSVLMNSSSKNGTIREGDSVNLTCATTGCSLSQSEFIWVKDKERLQETHSTLHFNRVSCRNKGNYSCAFKGGGNQSEEFQLDIQGEKFTSYFLIHSSQNILTTSKFFFSTDTNPPESRTRSNPLRHLRPRKLCKQDKRIYIHTHFLNRLSHTGSWGTGAYPAAQGVMPEWEGTHPGRDASPPQGTPSGTQTPDPLESRTCSNPLHHHAPHQGI
uniref:Ig-like domain-containing protein n=1 Tax=Scleropages formosus TaxID=113540 RepID=A0A8C9S3A5_SCLFO